MSYTGDNRLLLRSSPQENSRQRRFAGYRGIWRFTHALALPLRVPLGNRVSIPNQGTMVTWREEREGERREGEKKG